MTKPTYDPLGHQLFRSHCLHTRCCSDIPWGRCKQVHPSVKFFLPLLSWYRIYHSPTIPQLICWQLSPGAWNVNKAQNESDVHCSSRHWVQVLHQLTWFLENPLATLKLACSYNLFHKILVSMVMRSAFLTCLGKKKKKKWGDDNISEKMKFSVSFHSWTASCRLVNRLVAFCPFYTWKNWVINSPQALFAKRRFNELCSSIRTEEDINSLPVSMQKKPTTNGRMALPSIYRIY